MEIGIDIEQIERFELEKDAVFVRQNFTSEEISYAFSKTHPAMHLCGIFCAKEAVIKAITENPLMRDIHITHIKDKPVVQFSNDALNKYTIMLSISHCKTHAVANVVVQ